MVTYATKYGSTQEVAEEIAATIRKNGLTTDIQPMQEVKTIEKYNSIIMGAPLSMFHWNKDAHRFLLRHRDVLIKLPVAVFALGPTHVPYDKEEWQSSRDQLNKELSIYPWFKPVAIEMFGGRYDPSKLHFPISLFTGKVPASDIRDWEKIRSWAGNIPKKILV